MEWPWGTESSAWFASGIEVEFIEYVVANAFSSEDNAASSIFVNSRLQQMIINYGITSIWQMKVATLSR